MREDGYINAAKVNYIGKQNLISLAFEAREHVNKDGLKEKYFPFREINKTHHIVAFYFYHEDFADYQSFWEDCALKRFDRKWAEKNKERLEQPIKEYWSEILGLEYKQQKKNDRLQQAWDYLAYKTIKILHTYIHYSDDWKVATDSPFNKDKFKKRLDNLLKDSTHRTTKLRRTIAYLRFQGEKSCYLNKHIADLKISYEWMKTKLGEHLYPNNDGDYHNIEIEDLLPPPFMEVVLQLVDNEHLKQYKSKRSYKEIIPFEGLSSGERQIAYSIANIVYHLKNIESSKEDMNTSPNHLFSLRYKYVNILLDEVELYFHPDLQRRFVSLLVDSIKGLQLSAISGVNITLVTHSPFVLSDIPSENILCLSRSKDECLEEKTFAANIHDLFNNTFFLPYTVGELAKREIENIVAFYKWWQADIHSKNGWHITNEEYDNFIERNWVRMRYIANVVGDEYLGEEINDMLDEFEEWRNRGTEHEKD